VDISIDVDATLTHGKLDSRAAASGAQLAGDYWPHY